MAMATKINFLGYVAWLRGIDVSEKICCLPLDPDV